MSLLVLSNIVLEVLGRIIRQEKETKTSRLGEKRSKTIFADGMSLNTENLRTLLKTIRMNKSGKHAGCNANIIFVSLCQQE